MSDDDKKTDCAKVWMSRELYLELSRLSAAEDRKLSEYIGVLLRRHVYGHAARPAADNERPE